MKLKTTDIIGGSGTTTTVAAQTSDLLATQVGKYLRFTYAGNITLNVPTEASAALPADGEWHIRNASPTGNLTIAAASGVMINPPYNGSLVIPPNGTVTLKRVAADTFDLMGQTV